MNAEIAQLVAVVCRGNAELRDFDLPDFFPDNSTCQFCERVEFVVPVRGFFLKWKEKVIAHSPDKWFQQLCDVVIEGLELCYQSSGGGTSHDRELAGFVGGGGNWSIKESIWGEYHQWAPIWRAGSNADDRRPWSVTYRRIGSAASPSPPSKLSPIDAARQLDAALKDILGFAAQSAEDYVEHFDGARQALRGKDCSRIYHKDLAPVGALTDEGARLLDACQLAWVFGGMGSWNDMSFEGDAGRQYELVSEALFVAVNSAIVVAANSSFPSAENRQ